MPLRIVGAAGRALSNYLPEYRQRQQIADDRRIASEQRQVSMQERQANAEAGRLLMTAMASDDVSALSGAVRRISQMPNVSGEVLQRVREQYGTLKAAADARKREASEQQYRQAQDRWQNEFGLRKEGYQAGGWSEEGVPQSITAMPQTELSAERQADITAKQRQSPRAVELDPMDYLKARANERTRLGEYWDALYTYTEEVYDANSTSTVKRKRLDPNAPISRPDYIDQEMQRWYQEVEPVAKNAGIPIPKPAPPPAPKPDREPPTYLNPGTGAYQPPGVGSGGFAFPASITGAPPIGPAARPGAASVTEPGSIAPVSVRGDTTQAFIAEFEADVDKRVSETGRPRAQIISEIMTLVPPQDRAILERYYPNTNIPSSPVRF